MQPAQVEDPAAALPEESALSAVPEGGGAAPADTGSLLISVTSKVKHGTLSVLVDGAEVLERDLAATGKKFQRLVKKVTQAAHEELEESIELAAGMHTVTVRLQLAGKPAPAEETVELELLAGTSRTIEISAGKKFGVGDALELRLGD
jgi:hypothetical protein